MLPDGDPDTSNSVSANSAPYATNELFHVIANKASHGVGSPWAFMLATATVIVWAVTGPAIPTLSI